MAAFVNAGERPSGHTDKRPAPRVTIILFTDVVDHVSLFQRLGDATARAVMREHDAIMREALRLHGGTEVKTAGDGFMASFDSVTSATECAIAVQRMFAERNRSASEPIAVRCGLNAGEPIEEQGDYFGSSVNLAARVAALARGGEIFVPEPVRHLLSGKNFSFADRGEHTLRGFDDPVRVFEVAWQ
jgi:class 3 adenylate cyclase